MLKPVLVYKFNGEKSEFESLEELLEYVEEEINVRRKEELDMEEVLNGYHFEYSVEWKMV